MAKRFVRNIRDTEIRNDKKEPLSTNSQNDLLSDNEDVFVRNKEEYHALTDNIKTIATGSERIVTIVNNKNDAVIDVLETRISSDDTKLIVKDTAPNKFILELDLTDYYTQNEVDNLLSNYYSKSEVDSTITGLENIISDLENRIVTLEEGV